MNELLQLLRHNKRWWLLPILVLLALFLLLAFFGRTADAPFQYTPF